MWQRLRRKLNLGLTVVLDGDHPPTSGVAATAISKLFILLVSYVLRRPASKPDRKQEEKEQK